MPTIAELEQLRHRLELVSAGDPLVITTSGSTEQPKRVALSWVALQAAAEATASRIGAGNWLLALPTEYIAGVMVEVRARAAGRLTAVAAAGGFAAAAAELPAPKYVSLVPTQLAALLDDDTAVRALREFTTVLIGGQRLPATLRRAAEAEGITVVASYGSTETAGGCVFDGRPLPGVDVRVDDDDRLWITGPMLADGYLTESGAPDVERTRKQFVEWGGRRWYRTDDRARLHEDERGIRLEILGRADDVIISGGLKLDLAEVQRFLDETLGPDAAVALPIDGTRWGQSLGVRRLDAGLAVAPAWTDDALAAALSERFGPVGRPIISNGDALVLSNGKPDRRAYQDELHKRAADLGLLASMDGDE